MKRLSMNKHLQLAIILCLTLGLAPFYPHAHIWKQFKNLWLGRTMTGMDWFDLVLHSAPWVFLIVVLVGMYRQRKHSKT